VTTRGMTGARPARWRRHSCARTLGRAGAQLTLALVAAWMLARLGIRWDYVADSPAQIGDLLGRMLPPDWGSARALWAPLGQTINIATLGTGAGVLLSLPIAILAALNTTPSRATYALARLVMVVSRAPLTSCARASGAGSPGVRTAAFRRGVV
jgi:phosphonate transport system permease protein